MPKSVISPTNIARLGQASVALRNLVPASEDAAGWLSVSGTLSGPLGLNALGRFSGHRLTSAAAWGRASPVTLSVTTGAELALSVYVRAETSTQMRIVVWYPAASFGDSVAGPLAAMPSAPGAGLALIDNTLQSDGQTRLIRYRYTASRNGDAQIGIGPNTSASGSIILLAVQVERGPIPSSYQTTPV